MGRSELFFSGQKSVIGVEYDLSRADWCGQPKVIFGFVHKNLSDQYILARHYCVERDKCDQVVRRFLLRNFAGYDNTCAGFTLKLNVTQLDARDGGSTQPAVVEPVERFMFFMPERAREVLFKCLNKIIGVDDAPLILGPYFAERAYERIVGQR